jgi:hypothetical protein
LQALKSKRPSTSITEKKELMQNATIYGGIESNKMIGYKNSKTIVGGGNYKRGINRFN